MFAVPDQELLQGSGSASWDEGQQHKVKGALQEYNGGPVRTAQTIDFIKAEEAGCQEASDLHEHTQANTIRRSTYQQLKSEEKKKKCGRKQLPRSRRAGTAQRWRG